MQSNLFTTEAKNLWFEINNYFLMCDDPKYNKLHKFRTKILAIKDGSDRTELISYFEREANQELNYFTNPY